MNVFVLGLGCVRVCVGVNVYACVRVGVYVSMYTCVCECVLGLGCVWV